MSLILMKAKFSVKEAALARANNPNAKLCDLNNFCYFSFKGKQVKKIGSAGKQIDHMVKSALEAGATADAVKQDNPALQPAQ